MNPADAAPIPPPLARPFESAARCARSWFILLFTVVAALGVDLVTKYLAFQHVAGVPVVVVRDEVIQVGPARIQSLIPPHEPVTVVPWLLDFQLVLNAGAVFGAGQGKRWFFVTFTCFAMAFAFWMFARWTDRRDRLSHVAIGLLMAGGMGNLYDRMKYACVRDFLHPLPDAVLPFGLAWPSGERLVWPYVSNIADAFLILGIGVLVIKLWRADEPNKQATDRLANRTKD